MLYRFPYQRMLVFGALIGCGAFLTGCFGPSHPEEKIKEPPFIPAPEAPAVKTEPEIPALYVGAYADLMDYGDQTRHNPRLVEAVAHAIRIGVLTPNGVQDRFNARNPINYSEFRQWVLAYQTAAAGTRELKQDAPERTKGKAQDQPRELASIVSRTDDADSPMNPLKLTLIPEEPRFGGHALSLSRPLNREELCALYVLLAQKQEAANALSTEAIEDATPGGKAINKDEALSQFKDYPSISPWARPYIAIAYQDGLLQKVMNLSGTRLTIDEGFNPNAPVSREEAILLLEQLYGYVKSPAPKANQHATSVKQPVATSDPGLQRAYIPAEPSTETQPLRHLRTVEETGPDGSRSARSLERAE